MAATANITWPAPTGGSINQQIQYRPAGSTSPWTVYSTVGPTVTSSVVSLANPGNYEWQVVNICANGITTPSAKATYYVCSCPPGYTKDTTNGNCVKVGVINATILFSNYCLAPSTLRVYSQFFTRIYNIGFSSATIGESVTSRPQDVYAEYTTPGQWAQDPNEVPKTDASGNVNYVTGPMNRAGVWVDTDCNGVKDSLTRGKQTTISYAYNNTGAARRMYVGVGGDNIFTLKVNGVQVAKTPEDLFLDGSFNSDRYFKIWHVFPVSVTTGWNYFNFIGTGDGTQNDAMAMTVYDLQTPQSFDGVHATGTTYDQGLNVIFTTGSMRGQHIDIATCTDGYSLDTSGGPGNYKCTRTETASCG